MYDLVTTNGCFDSVPLHQGHMFFLGFARAQGRRLVVGLNADSYIIAHKRPNPIPADQRKMALMELGFIEDVIVFHEPDPVEFIKRVGPDAHCVGADYPGDLCIERKYCTEHGIAIIEIPRVGKWSSTVERGGNQPEWVMVVGRTLQRLASEVYLDTSGGTVAYGKDYWEKYVRYSKTRLGEALTIWRKGYVEALSSVYNPGKLLDYGCGTGDIVRLDDDPGWYGYDINARTAAVLEGVGRFDPRPVFSNYGAVSFFDSLEHLPEVQSVLMEFPRHTVLVVSIPLWDFPADCWNENDMQHLFDWRHWRPKEHFLYASPRGFEAWVKALGFEILDHNTMETSLGRGDIHTYAMRKP